MTKVAILILAHKNPGQIRKFINQFNKDKFDIYLHFDLKTKLTEDDIKLFDSDNIFLLSNEERVKTNWGDITLIDAELSLLNKAYASGPYLFFILCSGQDLLIRTSDELYAMLSNNQDKNFNTPFEKSKFMEKRNQVPYLKCMTASEGIDFYLRNIYKYLTGGRQHTFSFLKSKFYKTHNFFYGYQWFAYNQETVTYIINYLKNNPDYLKFFRNKLVPDECFFQTIIHTNQKLANSLRPGITYARFPQGSNSPVVFKTEDLNELVSPQTPYFIARKFDEKFDNNIIDIIIKKVC